MTPLVLGVALVAKSPAVVIALLPETGADGPVSQVMLGAVVLCDFVVLLMYSAAATFAISAAPESFNTGSEAFLAAAEDGRAPAGSGEMHPTWCRRHN